MVKINKITNEIHQIDLNSTTCFSGNAYVIKDKQNILIDTGCMDRDGMKNALGKLGLKPEDINRVLYTHGHWDHIGLGTLFTKAEQKMSKHDAEYVNDERDDFTYRHGLDRNGKYPHVDTFISNNEIIDTGKYKLKALHTPGHIRGHYVFLEEKHKLLFSGDLLFPQSGIGRTDLLTRNYETEMKSIQKVQKLKWNVLLSGHGEPEHRNEKQ